MARNIFAACGALAIAGVALSAQTTPPPSSTAAQPQSTAGTVTITGCLKPNASAPMGSTPSGTTPGATGTSGAGASTQFLLTDAKMSSGSSSPTGGTTGTAGAAANDEYVLRAESPSVNLASHLNHQIEITGRVASSSSGAAPSTTTPPATGAAGAGSANRPTVTVTAVKMIAAECK
jgi:hypothetical protein